MFPEQRWHKYWMTLPIIFRPNFINVNDSLLRNGVHLTYIVVAAVTKPDARSNMFKYTSLTFLFLFFFSFSFKRVVVHTLRAPNWDSIRKSLFCIHLTYSFFSPLCFHPDVSAAPAAKEDQSESTESDSDDCIVHEQATGRKVSEKRTRFCLPSTELEEILGKRMWSLCRRGIEGIY